MYTRMFSTLGCPEFSLDDVVALGKVHGIDRFEMRALGGTLDLPAYFAATFGAPAQLARRLVAANARVSVLDTSFRVFDGDEDDRAKLLAFLPWADALGVRWLRVFDGGSVIDGTALAYAAHTLTWWQSVRRERGFRADLMIETHDVLLDSTKIGRFIAAMPPGSVHLLWDAHHTWKRGDEAPLATWGAVAPHVVHIHVKDSVSQPSEQHPFTYVLPGTGEFPMGSLRDKLVADYSGGVSLEWEKLWHPYLGPLDAALRAAEVNHWW